MEKSGEGKAAYLLTDKGFVNRFGINFLFLSSLVAVFAHIPILREAAVDSYFRINDIMLTMAHQYAWWSLLGLLSSSCCALQLILNSMSMGCAGFNTVLGPIRPTLLSLTVLVQMGSWYVAWPRPWQWAPTAVSSAVVLILSFLPELLNSYTFLRTRRRKAIGENSAHHSTIPSSLFFCFKMTTVGCSACISTISGVLERLDEVQDFEASLEKGVLQVKCREGTTRECIMESLEDAGFTMEPITFTDQS
jgi:copper chaperone CopZ